MGHLVNPVSLRLSVNSFWNSTWSLVNSFNYANLFKKDYTLFQFLNWFIKKSKFGKFNIIISHYKVYRVSNRLIVNLYYYNAGVEEKKYHFQSAFLLSLLRARRYNIKQSFGDFASPRFKAFYKFVMKTIISSLYWQLINNALNFYFLKLDPKVQTQVNVFALDFLYVTADIISNYISLKLQQRHSLNWILRPIVKDLTTKVKKKIFLGYKIVCSGRFTRKQIATYMWLKQGSLKLNTFSSLVKYSEARVRLKYGACGVKVWLNYGVNQTNLFQRQLLLVYPLHTPFKYILDFKNGSLVLFLNYWHYLYIKIMFLKSRFFSLYKFYLDAKVKSILNYSFYYLYKRFLFRKFKVQQLSNNILTIKMLPPKIRTYKIIRRRLYE